MKTAILIVVGIIVFLALLGGVVALIGSRLTEKHVALRSLFLQRPPQDVYAVVRDFSSAPTWRSDITKVEVQTPVRFREIGKQDIW